MVKPKPATKAQALPLPKPAVEERVRATDHSDPYNRVDPVDSGDRDRSHEELNPILYYEADGTIDAETTLDNLGDLTDFLANLECVDMPFEHEAFRPGLYLIHRTMRAAIRELEAQCAAVREAKHQEVRHG